MEKEYVYILQPESSPELYKIGRTNNIEKRMKAYPKNSKLIHQIETNDSIRLERELHVKYQHRCVKNEWFELKENDIENLKAITEISYRAEDGFDDFDISDIHIERDKNVKIKKSDIHFMAGTSSELDIKFNRILATKFPNPETRKGSISRFIKRAVVQYYAEEIKREKNELILNELKRGIDSLSKMVTPHI